mmetsp:Transcript_3500/g.10089  ORF Transcript_3500/g.10089 Transcript_3500/m.10089 type:complete len:239 (+) Transcript_3500:8264-8980(+)
MFLSLRLCLQFLLLPLSHIFFVVSATTSHRLDQNGQWLRSVASACDRVQESPASGDLILWPRRGAACWSVSVSMLKDHQLAGLQMRSLLVQAWVRLRFTHWHHIQRYLCSRLQETMVLSWWLMLRKGMQWQLAFSSAPTESKSVHEHWSGGAQTIRIYGWGLLMESCCVFILELTDSGWLSVYLALSMQAQSQPCDSAQMARYWPSPTPLVWFVYMPLILSVKAGSRSPSATFLERQP